MLTQRRMSQSSSGSYSGPGSNGPRSVWSSVVSWYNLPLTEKFSSFSCTQGIADTMSMYSLFQGIYTFIITMFDLYYLISPAPDTLDYEPNLKIPYDEKFWERNFLISSALCLLIASVVNTKTSLLLVYGLQTEESKEMVPWLYSYPPFLFIRYFCWLIFTAVSDATFISQLPTVAMMITQFGLSAYGWVLMGSYYASIYKLNQVTELIQLNREYGLIISQYSTDSDSD